MIPADKAVRDEKGANTEFRLSLSEMFQLAYVSLRRQARKKLRGFPSVRRWDDTDDVLQSAAMRLCQLLRDEPPQSWRQFYGLVGQHIRWSLLSLARKYNGPNGLGRRMRSNLAETGGEAVEFDQVRSEIDEPAQLAEWTEFHLQIETLAPDVAEVFHLIWYLELTQSQTAAALGISEVTVRRHWRSARIELGRYFTHGVTHGNPK